MLKVNHLNGFGAGDASLTALTQVLSATSIATTITAPNDILAGDLIVLADLASGTTGATSVVPTNFTLIADRAVANSGRLVSSYKKADGTESGASITGMAAGVFGRVAKAMYVFRGNIPVTTFTLLDVGQDSGSGNPAAQTVTASGGAPPLVVLGFYGTTSNGSRVDPRTFTVGGSPAKDAELQSVSDGSVLDADVWIAFKTYSVGQVPADAVVDMDDEGDANYMESCYIACS